MKLAHPYKGQPQKAFWKQAVAQHNPLDISGWYSKKYEIGSAKIATAGSCFAQHIGANLRKNGYSYIDVEPCTWFLDEEDRPAFGYGIYSARYGNVYTTRQLLQLIRRALGEFRPSERAWKHKSGFVDPFRPTIEPEPMDTEEEVFAAQKAHLARVRDMFANVDVFVFTLGLTEAWISREDGSAFPICPGVSGGEFDNSKYALVNLDYPSTMADLENFVQILKHHRRDAKVLLTVSPVPLNATATQDHVAVATTYSKSVLRAVAGALCAKYDFIDYFPSFEIISSSPMRSMFFNPDMRTVSSSGVAHVMKQFFVEHPPSIGGTIKKPTAEAAQNVVCDEELLRMAEAAQ
jgi:hypothetical protein